MKRADLSKLVFLDEAGANLAMGRSHAWVRKGEIYIEPRPMNWGDNLTMVGAIKHDGWLTLGTMWGSMNGERFDKWVRRQLAPKLKKGDIVIMDNLPAHKNKNARKAIEARGARIKFLPPYSPDYNPIEPGWAIVKKEIRAGAPRTKAALRTTSRRARWAVTPRQCKNWCRHAGYRPRFK